MLALIASRTRAVTTAVVSCSVARGSVQDRPGRFARAGMVGALLLLISSAAVGDEPAPARPDSEAAAGSAPAKPSTEEKSPAVPSEGGPAERVSGTPASSGPVKPERKDATGSPTMVEKVLRDLSFFPYVIVVPPENQSTIATDGTAIVPLGSLEKWLADEISRRQSAESRVTVSSVDLDLDVTSDPVVGRAVLQIRMDGAGSHWAPLSFLEASLKRASVREWLPASADKGGMQASEVWTPMIRRGASGYEVRLDRPGNFELTLEFLVEVYRQPGVRSMKVSPPTATIARAAIRSSQDLSMLKNAVTQTEIPLSADRRSAEFAINSGQGLSIEWRPMTEGQGESPAAVVRTRTEARIEPKTTQLDTVIDVETQTELSSATLAFSLEDGNVQILPVQNEQPLPHDLEWSEEGGGRRCVVRLSRGVSGKMQLRISSQRPTVLGAAGMELSAVEWVGRSRPDSMLLVWWSANLWIRVRPEGDIRRVPVTELSEDIVEGSPRQVFRLLQPSARILVTAERARPVLTAMAESDLLVGREAHLTTRFVMNVRGAQTDSFLFVVPRTMRNIEISPADLLRLEEQEVDQESPTRVVKAVLAEVIEDKDIEVALHGEIPVDQLGTNQIALPSLEAERLVQGSLSVRVEPGMRLVLDDTGTEYLRREPIPEGRDPALPAPYWYFRRQAGNARLAFHMESLPTTVDSSTEYAFIRGEKDLEVRAIMRFRARYAPFDEVSVAVPAGLQGVQVSSDSLVEGVRLEAGATVPLRLRNPSSSCEVQLDYRLPLPVETPGSVEVPLVLPRGSMTESWSGRIFSERGLRAVVRGEWIGTIPPPSRVVESGRRPIADVRPVDLASVPTSLTIQFEPLALLATLVIPRVAIEEVFTPGGGRWARKRWLISKHRSRDVSLKMPAGARRLNVFVDGQPAADVAASDQIVRVRLPAVDAPTSLEIDYDFPETSRRGVLEVTEYESPVIIEDAAIEQVRWVFRVMEDRLLFRWGSSGGLSSLSLASLLARQEADPLLSETSDVEWLGQAGYDVAWSPRVREVSVPRVWQFTHFNHDRSLRLISVREPFWVLACSGSCLVLILALARLPAGQQLRIGVGALVVLIGLLAAVPELVDWLWVGARWGVGLGFLAVLVHSLILFRRRRAPLVSARRGARGLSMGSSILRQLEPKTRITTRSAKRS